MSSYEVEHSIPPSKPSDPQHPRPPHRIDFSTFFSAFEQVDTHTTANAHALPIPGDVAAAHRLAAEGYGQMRIELGDEDEGVLGQMIDILLRGADVPPKEVEGVSAQFLDELERVPKKSLKPNDECPICGIPFLDDPYPLIVRLSCHKSHIFDLDCIAPWLKLHATCPLDRKDLLRKGEVGGGKGGRDGMGGGGGRDGRDGMGVGGGRNGRGGMGVGGGKDGKDGDGGEKEEEEEEWDEMYA